MSMNHTEWYIQAKSWKNKEEENTHITNIKISKSGWIHFPNYWNCCEDFNSGECEYMCGSIIAEHFFLSFSVKRKISQCLDTFALHFLTKYRCFLSFCCYCYPLILFIWRDIFWDSLHAEFYIVVTFDSIFFEFFFLVDPF